MVVLALIPLARRSTPAAESERHRLPERAWLSAAIADLSQIQRERVAADGWTDDNVWRTLATMRLIAAAAIEQPVSQKPLKKGPAPEGRLFARHGLVRPIYASVSSPVTADDVARASAGSATLSTTRRQQLEGLQSGLSEMTNALYRKDPSRDATALDEAVRHAISVARDLVREHNWWNTRWARR
jgi:hypothetical protein